MIFKSVRIKEGMFERVFDFPVGANLIHSVKNSCGKTTLLRFMLYSLGYRIPSTRKMEFSKCEVETKLVCESCGEITLLRYSDDFVAATIYDKKHTFVLPAQLDELHHIIWGTQNSDILHNMLGAFYVDQEKGWAFLNRGVVIGKIHFNIEELIRGLSGRDCTSLIREETRLSRDLSKYRQMFSVAQYRATIENSAGNIASDSYEEKIDAETAQLMLQEKELKDELRRIDRTLSDNRKFRSFVAEMKLLVQAPNNGPVFPVTKENIVGLDDAIDLLVAKRKMVSSKLVTVESRLNQVQKNARAETEQLAFYESESMIEVFDKRIVSIPMNPRSIRKEIRHLEERRTMVREEIERRTKFNNPIITQMFHDLISYATELGLFDGENSISPSYLFTSNLKELSGAILHKTVFAFRLSYINAIESVLKIKLPIILDSPSGKEVDQANIQLMVDILSRDFSDHQIIIASIYKYNFPDINLIEIENKLISKQ